MAGNPLTDPNWAADVTDSIVNTVDKVRDRTTKPLVMAARGLVFGLLAAFLGILIVGMLLVGVTRAIIALIEWPLDHDTAVWISYLVIGAALCGIGALFMARRQSEESV
jgi:uncharacterized membrane protein YedE/YeeE